MKTEQEVKTMLQQKTKELEDLPYKDRKLADVIHSQICMCQWFLRSSDNIVKVREVPYGTAFKAAKALREKYSSCSRKATEATKC